MKKVFVLVLLVIFSGCSSYSIISQKFNEPIKIDGRLDDWNGKLQYFKDEKMAVGVSNDSENLYLSLSTADKGNIIKMLHMGFTIWLEPGNEKGETIGIQYPIKEKGAMPNKIVESNRNSFGSKKFEKMVAKIKINNSEYLLINDDNFPLGAYSLAEKNGVKIGLGYKAGKLIYEIKIPKKGDKYFPINLTSIENGIITLKFTSIKPNRSITNRAASSSRRDGIGGRTGGMQRGRGRRPNGMPRSGNSNFTSPIDFEIKVTFTE